MEKYRCKRTIKYLIIHCSATRVTTNFTVERLRTLHVKQNGWRDIGYNFYITKDGTVHSCRPLDMVGAHTLNYNATSIGICYEGGLDANGKARDTRTDKQKESMLQLLRDLKQVYPAAKILGHYETGAKKACPCFCASKEYESLNV